MSRRGTEMGGTGGQPKFKLLKRLDAFGAISFIKCQDSGEKIKGDVGKSSWNSGLQAPIIPNYVWQMAE